jgi:hypothetical protein
MIRFVQSSKDHIKRVDQKSGNSVHLLMEVFFQQGCRVAFATRIPEHPESRIFAEQFCGINGPSSKLISSFPFVFPSSLRLNDIFFIFCNK